MTNTLEVTISIPPGALLPTAELLVVIAAHGPGEIEPPAGWVLFEKANQQWTFRRIPAPDDPSTWIFTLSDLKFVFGTYAVVYPIDEAWNVTAPPEVEVAPVAPDWLLIPSWQGVEAVVRVAKDALVTPPPGWRLAEQTPAGDEIVLRFVKNGRNVESEQ